MTTAAKRKRTDDNDLENDDASSSLDEYESKYRMVNIPSRVSLLQRAVMRLPTLTKQCIQRISIATPKEAIADNHCYNSRHFRHDGTKAETKGVYIEISYSVYNDLSNRVPSKKKSLAATIIEYIIPHDLLQLGSYSHLQLSNNISARTLMCINNRCDF
jgi:regulatory protein YycH of two-component signal transduction system YycFG